MTQTQHSSPAARRYARALFELASEKGELGSVHAGMKRLGQLAAEKDFRSLLLDPRITETRKASAIQDFLGSDADGLLNGLLNLLQRRKRTVLLSEIPSAFELLVDEAAGRVRGVVESAQELDDAALAALQSSLSQGTGKEVILDPSVVPELLGGVRVTLAGTRYDGSARGRLDQITKRLAAAELG
jgi:F-type H+-transporting ATPase subunit delta